ncbi:hypothetical protein [Streptomyces fagopyri]|uniref:hypothetical protein n=1 Tax=Streptomyces fagopyri TaxID=2662397 RepID=UPI0033FDE77D
MDKTSRVVSDLRCDEHPFASTYESTAENSYDPEPIRFSFSAERIAEDDGQAGALIL